MFDLVSGAADVTALLGAGSLTESLALTHGQFGLFLTVVFLAGVVRGFTGFAQSALIMASLAVVIPPVSLIPVCYVLEGTASLLLFRGGAREADFRIVTGLAVGSAIGVPLGLQATLHLPADASRLVALVLILLLAALQLLGRRMSGVPPMAAGAKRWLATPAGLCGAGLLAGVATGLAHVGGMIVALYVLATNAPPARMRASLVMFLFVGMFTSGVWLVSTDVLDRLALMRGLVLAPAVAAGVLIGARLFGPALQGIHRNFCLTLLIGLALAGLVRQIVAG